MEKKGENSCMELAKLLSDVTNDWIEADRERIALMEENRLLRQQLRRNGITPCTEQEGAKIITMRTL
jgi:hypothetical protein